MTIVSETAYPRLPSNVSPSDLRTLFSLTRQEIKWLSTLRVDSDGQRDTAVYLKCFQSLGYFPRASTIPATVVQFISLAFKLDPVSSVSPSQRASHRIKQAIREFSGVSLFSPRKHEPWLFDFACQMTATKESPIDIINALIEMLIKESFELPGFSTLDRYANRARASTLKQLFTLLSSALPDGARATLDDLLVTRDDKGLTLWNRVKREPRKPTSKHIAEYIEHARWLSSVQEAIGSLPEIPEQKRDQCVLEARAYSADRMKRLQARKRYSLMAILIHEQRLYTNDCLVDLLVRDVRRLHNSARKALLDFQLRAATESASLVTLLRDVAGVCDTSLAPRTRLDQIMALFDNEPAQIIDRCNSLVLHDINNYLPFLSVRYTRPMRKNLLDILALIRVQSITPDNPLIACLRFLLTYRNTSFASIRVSAIDDLAPKSKTSAVHWVAERWHKLLFLDTTPHIANRSLRPIWFELCVLTEISRQLQSGDLYIDHSTRYDDYRTHLVDDQTLRAELPEFCTQSGLHTSGSAFAAELKSALIAQADQTDDRFTDDQHVVIEQGRCVLKRRPGKTATEGHEQFDAALRQHVPEISIIDLLIDTTRWLSLKPLFGPLSGHQGQLSDFDRRLVITLFCYGCNLGPTQTARSIDGVSRKQIAYLNLSNTSEKNLVDATELVINAYNQYDLPRHWGPGNTASVDGTRFDMYEQNLLSEYHVRYASYGGVGYYLVSDTYIALFSRFIPCGVREAVHLIDGLMENDSDIQPTRIHGDTHAQSTVVFGIAHLLGIQLMPRIKDINSLILFKPDRRHTYAHIDELFSDGVNFEPIRKHYREMLRIAVSIKLGKVSASTIIRRLGSEGVRNSLFFAFRELGRVVRTRYLLEYIGDIELRETVHAATCKSEEFNNFLQWVFFYNSGIIQENLRHEQCKIVKYNHLVANLIILHNANAMTRAIKRVRRDGFDVRPEHLAELSPYRTGHINLLGRYPLQVNRRAKAQVFRL